MKTNMSGLGAIRNAVASGDFSKALVLWQDHAGHLEERARRGDLNAASLVELKGLLCWTRSVALTFRAQGEEEIARHRAACRVAQVYSINVKD